MQTLPSPQLPHDKHDANKSETDGCQNHRNHNIWCNNHDICLLFFFYFFTKERIWNKVIIEFNERKILLIKKKPFSCRKELNYFRCSTYFQIIWVWAERRVINQPGVVEMTKEWKRDVLGTLVDSDINVESLAFLILFEALTGSVAVMATNIEDVWKLVCWYNVVVCLYWMEVVFQVDDANGVDETLVATPVWTLVLTENWRLVMIVWWSKTELDVVCIGLSQYLPVNETEQWHVPF